jgi:hypothetical protein
MRFEHAGPEPIDCPGACGVAIFLLTGIRQEEPAINSRTGLARPIVATVAALTAVAAVAGEVAAQSKSGWLLVTPPPVAERRVLMKVYAASSDSEVEAAVASLPGDEQARLVTKVYKILTIPAAAERTEALLATLQDPAAPMASWRTLEAFDSATSCEDKRARALQSLERAAARIRTESPEADELAVEDWTTLEGLAACRMSRCVPASPLSRR